VTRKEFVIFKKKVLSTRKRRIFMRCKQAYWMKARKLSCRLRRGKSGMLYACWHGNVDEVTERRKNVEKEQ